MALFLCGGSDLLENKPISVTPKPTADQTITYSATSDGYDGYEKVTVTVPKYATLGTKSITTNGTQSVISGNNSYSAVNVNVPNILDTIRTQLWYNANGVLLGYLKYPPGTGSDYETSIEIYANTRNQVTETGADFVDLRGVSWNNYKYLIIRTTGPLSPVSRTQSDVILQINAQSTTWGYPTSQHSALMYGRATSNSIAFNWYSIASGTNDRPLLIGIWGCK